MPRDRVPAALEDITAAWLESALHAGGALPAGGRITEARVEPFPEGLGMLGKLARVVPTYEGDRGKAPASVVVKVPSVFEENRRTGNQFGFYEREIRFYRDLAPKTDLRVPHCYHAAMDGDAFVLVLEDLGHLGAADQVAGLSRDQALLAAEHVGRFHAAWWDAPELDGLDWLPPSNGPVTMQAAPIFRQVWPSFLERFGDCLPEGAVALGERVGAIYENILHRLAARPWTIVHSDFRLDNLLFGTRGTSEEVVVVDWQLSTKGCGCYDVAYLLCQSMPIEHRREAEDAVLRRWWDILTARGVRHYSWDRAREDYDHSTLVGLVIPVTAGGLMDLGNERGRALVTALAERSFTAALDRDAGRLLP